MQTRQSRIGALVLIAMITVVLGVLGLASPAGASSSSAASGTCVKPPDRKDDTIHVIGCLTDSRDKPPSPVPGVTVTVEDKSGNVVGKGVSNGTGEFDISIGKAIDVLGNSYLIKVDTSTLPSGTQLRDQSKKVVDTGPIKIQADIPVTFPIGPLQGGESKITQALQLAVGGLVFSLLLAMASLGLSMIFGTTGLTNFAHGELITFGAIVAFGIDQLSGDIVIAGRNCTMIVAIIVATVASVFFGWFQDKILWKPLRRRGTGLIAAMIVSIGLSIFLRNIFQYVAGADNHNYSQWTAPEPWHVGSVLITPKDVGVAALALVVLIFVTVSIQVTRIGKATRAVADNPALAASSGINVDRVISVVWSVGAGLAGLSGVLLGMTQGFDYQVGFKILLLVFAAVVLGGLGSVWGALLGSLIIGVFIEVSTLFIAPELKFVGALAVLIVVLLVRPQGLLGRAERVG